MKSKGSKIILQLFRKAEVSYTLSDISKAIGPVIDLVFIALFIGTDGVIVYNFNSYLMPIKRIRFCCLYSFLIECGCMVPVTFILLETIGYQGAWYAKVVSMAVVSLLAVIYICCTGKGSNFSDKMLLLPEGFGIPPEDELSTECSTAEEILELSKTAVAFAIERNAEEETSPAVIMSIAKESQCSTTFGVNTLFVRL